MKTHTFIAGLLWISAAAATHAGPAPFAWGLNSGDGTFTSRTSPVATDVSGVLSGETITSLATSSTAAHAIVITSTGRLYAWGENTDGQLGNGLTTSSSLPVAVDMTGALSGKSVVAVATGFTHSLALTSDGMLYAWGSNTHGELGDGTRVHRTTPVAVDMSGVLSGKTIIQLAAGGSLSAVLDSTGKVYTWGTNSQGCLGNATTSSYSTTAVAVVTPGLLLGKVVSKIRAGMYHMLAQTSDGFVFSWGQNTRGQVGRGTSITNYYSPAPVDISGVLASKTITDISAGFEHSMALTSDGNAYAWGADDLKALGDAAISAQSNSPVAVDTSGVLFGKTVSAIAAGTHTGLVITTDGDLYAWGLNSTGAIGDGTTTSRDTPAAVDMTGVLAGQAVSSIQAGYLSHVALASPSTSTITPASRFTYAADFGWLNWRWSAASPYAPAIESAILHGMVYSANVGWIDLGDGTPTSGIRYSQTGQDFGVNHDGAGALVGYAYGANIGWIRFAQTWNSPPRVNLTTGAMSGYAYSANCGWIHLGSLKTRISPGKDSDVLAGGIIGDGIADSWELDRLAAAGLGTGLGLLGSTTGSDYDHDGISDLAEYIADTNPFSASDRFAVTNFTFNPSTGDVDLDWTGSTRRSYTISYSSDLSTWQPAAPALIGGSADFTLAGPPVSKLFFRVSSALPLIP